MKIISFGPENKKLTKAIYEFQKELYTKDKYFVPQLKMEILGSKLLGAQGILRKNHPFHQHAKVQYFIALSDRKKILGTIAAAINYTHNDLHQEKTGFFGFFEFIEDYEVAKILLDTAKNWLKEQGMKQMRGPANFSTNETIGLLINCFDQVPYMNTPYNKPYYLDFFEKYGLKKEIDLIAELMPVVISLSDEEKKRKERLVSFISKIKERYKITLQDFNKKNPKEHLEIIKSLYHEAWKDNWGFTPLTEKEFAITADSLKLVADTTLLKIAYIDGEPGAFIGSLPDINECLVRSKKLPEPLKLIRLFSWLMRNKFTRARLMLFGIKEKFRKMGLDGVLFYESLTSATSNSRKYKDCEISWLLETNHLIINAAEKMNAKEYKRWRIFQIEI